MIPDAQQSSPAVLALRAQTREMRRRVQYHPLLTALTRENVLKEDYLRALTVLGIIYKVAEQGVPAEKSPSPVWRWLEMDRHLQSLGAPHAIPSHGFQLQWETPARLLGYLYAQHVSQENWATISAALERSLTFKPGIENHYFYGYGKKTEAYRKTFAESLERLDAAGQQEVADAAHEMLRWMAHCFDHSNY